MSMRPRVLLPFLLLLSSYLSCVSKTLPVEPDRRADKASLVLMALNAEWLWDGLPPEEGRVEFGDRRGSPHKSAEHMKAIAAIIAKADADIVLLCEVENLKALEMLNDRYLQGKGYRAFLVDGKDTHTGQDVGLLTRLDPIGDRISRDDRKGRSGATSKGVSKNLIARFESQGSKIAVIGVHFLAEPMNRERKAEREAQADAVRGIARDLWKDGYQVIVMGDLNDFDGAEDSLDKRGSRPITNVLKTIRDLDPDDSTDDLLNASAHLPQELRYTCFFDRNKDGEIDADTEFDAIDHILLSRPLYHRIRDVRIFHDHDPTKVTDHFPIVVKLAWPAAANR
ncbi:MAG: hypothetical protein HRF45_06950 [Fimbriimonadia bacterium]